MRSVLSCISVSYSMNLYLRNLKQKDIVCVPKFLFKMLEGVFRKINRNRSLREIAKGDFDILHVTDYDDYFLDCMGNKPLVITIHDMTIEKFPEFYPGKEHYIEIKKSLAVRASRIIAISECTKRDIVEIFGISADKIDVVYHGISKDEVAVGKPVGLPDKYILYVGVRGGYKNFQNMVEAFKRLSDKRKDLYLVLTGKPLNKSEKASLASCGLIDRIVVFSDVSDDTLYQLYANACIFVYPSLYEGFGIPILEAFSQNCPVVLSNASCFPEVAGDAGVYFDPYSVDDMAGAIESVLSDETLRKSLVEKGRERIRLFPWTKTAELTELTYRKVLGL